MHDKLNPKIKTPHGLLALAGMIFCAIPFVYNSCSQFRPPADNSAALLASLCRVQIVDGAMRAMRMQTAPSPFATQKVILAENAAGVAKRAQRSTIAGGTTLSAILDNNCLRANATRSDFLNLILSGQVPHPDYASQAYAFTLPSDMSSSDIEAAANKEACVTGISWEHKYKSQSTAMTFNDSSLFLQTHLSSINALTADSLFYAAPYGIALAGGNPVKVAVLDTGIDYNHPDLAANIWQDQQGFGVDATTIGSSSVSYLPMDISTIGHGTHVSGIVAAVSNNGIGIVGTMPFGAQIMPVKIFVADSTADEGVSTSTTYFYNGMQFAVLNGANVINISAAATGTDYDSVAQSGIQIALGAGIPVVVAMGNGVPMGQLVDGVNVTVVPAIYSTLNGVIGVASFDANTGLISNFSNYSTTYAEIAAPGEQSVTTGIYSTIPVSMSSYGQLSGTSQSTPMVSAAAALTIAWIRSAYNALPTPGEVERLIESSADNNSNFDNYVKNARQLDLYNLASAIMTEYPRTQGVGSTTMPAPINCGN